MSTSAVSSVGNNSEIIYIPGCPRQYHVDLQLRCFKNGHAKLLMEVLSWHVEQNELEVLFIDMYNTVSRIIFCDRPLQKFLSLAREYVPLTAGITVAHINSLDLYFEWYPSRPERLRKIQLFMSEHFLSTSG